MESIAQDCFLADGVFDQVTQPQVVAGQRAAGLHSDDPRVLALFTQPDEFRHTSLRDWIAQALGVPVTAYSSAVSRLKKP